MILHGKAPAVALTLCTIHIYCNVLQPLAPHVSNQHVSTATAEYHYLKHCGLHTATCVLCMGGDARKALM